MSKPPQKSPGDVDIIVPVFNEAACLDEFCARMASLGLAGSVLFVDNASTDDTVARIERFGRARLIRHARNLGYGASIRDGIAAAVGAKIVIIDADLEYPPEAIPDLVARLDQHAVVYGSRFLGQRPPDMPVLRRVGNRLISALFNLLYGQKTTDFYTGMKGFRRQAVDGITLRRDGFEHVVELGAELARRGFVIHEIPITYRPRSSGVSKMRHLPETLKYLWFVLKYRWRQSPRADEAGRLLQ